jgi:hypothetical protein
VPWTDVHVAPSGLSRCTCRRARVPSRRGFRDRRSRSASVSGRRNAAAPVATTRLRRGPRNAMTRPTDSLASSPSRSSTPCGYPCARRGGSWPSSQRDRVTRSGQRHPMAP